jgi:hypothetical protein
MKANGADTNNRSAVFIESSFLGNQSQNDKIVRETKSPARGRGFPMRTLDTLIVTPSCAWRKGLMNNGETRPSLSNDPRNRLSREARRRIIRATVNADKFIYDALASIGAQQLDPAGVVAHAERGKAAFEKARAVLIVLQSEYSKLGLEDEEYRRCIDDEIEAMANSSELSDAHRRSLKSEFFFPLDLPMEVKPVSLPSAHAAESNSKIQRSALRDHYLSLFPEKIKILDVCWAAKEHYREWKRWLQKPSPIKDGAKADRSFRAILTSGKRPLEYRPIERPPKWE